MSWVKIRLFTSSWNIWRQHIPLMENYDKELDATIEIEEIKEPEDLVPRIKFVNKPHGFSLADGQSDELIAIVPEEAKEEVIKAWKKIMCEVDPLEITKILLDVVYEYDEEPAVKIYYDEYKVEIEINPHAQ